MRVNYSFLSVCYKKLGQRFGDPHSRYLLLVSFSDKVVMAKIMDEDAMEALITSRTAAGCKLFLDTGCTGTWSGDSAGSVSVNNSPHRSPGMSLPLSNSYSGLVSLSRSSTPCRGRKTLMDDADKCIYNSLGSTSSSVGKVANA